MNSPIKNTPVAWPAILKYTGEAELTFIADQGAWNSESELHNTHYVTADMLIDSQGFVYSLADRRENSAAPKATVRNLSLEAVIALIKAHLSELGSCCVSKFTAPTIQQAIMMINHSSEL